MTEVVVLPGLDGTAFLLEPLCSRLRELGISARAIAYPPDKPVGYAELEDMVRAQLPEVQPFVLLGESFSGPLAIRIASNPPSGLVGLVLSTTFARSPIPQLRPLAKLVCFVPARPPMVLLAWWLLGKWTTPELEFTLRSALRSVSPATLRARATAALLADVSALLPSVNVPTLCLSATHDRLLASSAQRLLTTGLPRNRTTRVAGPHLLLQTAVEPCAREVAAFALGLGPNHSAKPMPFRGTAQFRR